MDKKELISFKGMVDGVRINLGDDVNMSELLGELEMKIENNKAFFGDGDCKISLGGRRLSAAEKERTDELLKRLLPMCRVEFEAESAKPIPQTDWLLAYKERGKTLEAAIESTEKSAEPEEFVSVFRSNRARLFEGTVKSGMTLRSDGHLVLLGSISEGASLIAVGNIIVVGGLYGTAHAGCNGHKGSYIIAMDMHPEGLAIAQTAEEFTYSDNDAEPETDDTDFVKKGLFDKFKKKPNEDLPVEKPDNGAVSAVALLKNNKIVLDNFTIEDFTNLKNMV